MVFPIGPASDRVEVEVVLSWIGGDVKYSARYRHPRTLVVHKRTLHGWHIRGAIMKLRAWADILCVVVDETSAIIAAEVDDWRTTAVVSVAIIRKMDMRRDEPGAATKDDCRAGHRAVGAKGAVGICSGTAVGISREVLEKAVELHVAENMETLRRLMVRHLPARDTSSLMVVDDHHMPVHICALKSSCHFLHVSHCFTGLSSGSLKGIVSDCLPRVCISESSLVIVMSPDGILIGAVCAHMDVDAACVLHHIIVGSAHWINPLQLP